jgi:hypothetical protein
MKLELHALRFLLNTAKEFIGEKDIGRNSEWSTTEKIKMKSIRNLFHKNSEKLYDKMELSRDVLNPNVFPILNTFRAAWSDKGWAGWGQSGTKIKKLIEIDFQNMSELETLLDKENEPNENSKRMWAEAMNHHLEEEVYRLSHYSEETTSEK